MFDWLDILAQRQRDGDTDWVKYLFGFVIFIIWAVSALASHLSKKQEQERRRRLRGEIERAEAQPPREPSVPPYRPPMRSSWQPVPPPRAPERRVIATPRAAPPLQPRPVAAPRAAQRPKPAKPRRAVATPPPVPVSMAASEFAPPQPLAATQITDASQGRRAKPAIANASALANWLNPRTLRQQFILTEILQPPIALRQPSPHQS